MLSGAPNPKCALALLSFEVIPTYYLGPTLSLRPRPTAGLPWLYRTPVFRARRIRETVEVGTSPVGFDHSGLTHENKYRSSERYLIAFRMMVARIPSLPKKTEISIYSKTTTYPRTGLPVENSRPPKTPPPPETPFPLGNPVPSLPRYRKWY